MTAALLVMATVPILAGVLVLAAAIRLELRQPTALLKSGPI